MENVSEAPFGQALGHVLQHFAGWTRQIESEYHRSETFRALCDDWWICVEARDRWRSSEDPVAAERRHEYGEWLAELEQEIEEWLKRPEPRTGST